MPTIISGALLNAYFPVLSRMHDTPREAAETATELLTLLAWTGLPLAALGWACGQHLIEMLLGPQFHASGPYFEWLSLSVGLSFVNVGIHTPLLAWGQQRLVLKCSAGAALANLGLSLALIPRFGPWGAVAAAVFAEGFFVLGVARARRRIGFGWHPLLPILVRPLACSAGVALVVAMMPDLLAQHRWSITAAAAAVLAGCMVVFEPALAAAGRKLLERG
jgi:O-antigen/teichoic acid export membrane protein